MTEGLSFDGLTLSRWWDRAAAFHPRAMWVGTLDLVHLDAPVRVLRPEPLEPLHRLLLRAIDATNPTDLDHLDANLGLGRSVLFRWLDQLRVAGLVRVNDHYALTSAGTAALSAGTAAWPLAERRRFTFACSGGSPHFVNWSGPPGASVASLTAAADVRWLEDCIARPTSWKRRTGFAGDVVAVDRGNDGPGLMAWKRLAVACGERPVVALVLTADTPPQLMGFVSYQGELDPTVPALQLDAGWDETFPELTEDQSGPRTELGGGWTLIGEGRLRRAQRHP